MTCSDLQCMLPFPLEHNLPDAESMQAVCSFIAEGDKLLSHRCRCLLCVYMFYCTAFTDVRAGCPPSLR